MFIQHMSYDQNVGHFKGINVNLKKNCFNRLIYFLKAENTQSKFVVSSISSTSSSLSSSSISTVNIEFQNQF